MPSQDLTAIELAASAGFTVDLSRIAIAPESFTADCAGPF